MRTADPGARYFEAISKQADEIRAYFGQWHCDYCTKPATHSVEDKLATIQHEDGTIHPARGLIRSLRCDEHSACE
jgi:phage-related protein